MCRKFRNFLIILGVGSALVGLLSGLQPNILASALGFPFQPLALLLRRLSLLGGAANVLAWALYILLSLLPAGAALLLKRRGHSRGIDWLLVLDSALLFYAYEVLINPGLLTTPLSSSLSDAFGCTFYSILVLWGLIRWTASVRGTQDYNPSQMLILLIRILEICMVFSIGYGTIAGFLSKVNTIAAANTACTDNGILAAIISSFSTEPTFLTGADPTTSAFGMTIIFQGISAAIDLAINVMGLLILIGLEEMILHMKKEPFSEETVRLSGQLSSRCLKYLIVSIAAGAGFNLLQVVFLSDLLSLNFLLNIPLLPVAVLLIAWLFSDAIRRGRLLKEDVDSFI